MSERAVVVEERAVVVETPTSQPYVEVTPIVNLTVPENAVEITPVLNVVVPEKAISVVVDIPPGAVDAHQSFNLNGKTPYVIAGAILLAVFLVCTKPFWQWF